MSRAGSGRAGSAKARRHRLGPLFPRPDSPFHVAVPHRRALRPGPVDEPHRFSEGGTVITPHSRGEVGSVTSPTELLGHPVALDVLDGVSGLGPEVPDKTDRKRTRL